MELLVTADNPWRGTTGSYPEYFYMTGNFDSDVETNLNDLKALQPGRPVMVMEYWAGNNAICLNKLIFYKFYPDYYYIHIFVLFNFLFIFISVKFVSYRMV